MFTPAALSFAKKPSASGGSFGFTLCRLGTTDVRRDCVRGHEYISNDVREMGTSNLPARVGMLGVIFEGGVLVAQLPRRLWYGGLKRALLAEFLLFLLGLRG